MVTNIDLIDTLINFGIFLATSLMTIVAIIALVVASKNKK